jgi:peptidoglycan/LPS O-acetylase OafA/YrhL
MSRKIVALEGLRGLAALAVVFNHLVMMLFPALKNWRQTTLLGQLLADTPLNLLHNGSSAVRLFYVLSGVVLSVGFFTRRDTLQLSSAACRRYPRLALPVAASVLFAYLLIIGGCMHNVAVADLLQRPTNDWFRELNNVAPSLAGAANEAFVSAFFGFNVNHSYNQVLWTMGIELTGSVLVFAFLAFLGALRNRWLFYVGGIALFATIDARYFVDFLAGIAIADAYCQVVAARPDWQFGRGPTLLLVALGLVLASLKSSVLIPLGLMNYGMLKEYWPTMGAVCLIVAALFSPLPRRILESRPIAWLGKVSFSLYLFHLPIISSLGAWLFIDLYRDRGFGYLSTSALVTVACTATTFVVAHLMAMTVERWSIDWPRIMFDHCFRPLPDAAHERVPEPRQEPAIAFAQEAHLAPVQNPAVT